MKTGTLPIADANPFDLDHPNEYLHWRDAKLETAATASLAPVYIRDADDHDALNAILRQCRLTNMALYQVSEPLDLDASRRFVAGLAARAGLRHLDRHLCSEPDGLAVLQVRDTGRAGEYIPYSNRPISWHTDGYYNLPEEQIRGLVLHCVHPAAEGGANQLMDPELLYIQLRDEDPDYIRVLMNPGVMTIPANLDGEDEIRPDRTGPVFSIQPENGALHMRYTARTRSITWLDHPDVRAAVARIAAILGGDSPWILRHRMQSGQGLICNNVLHTRDGFRDDDVDPAHQRRYLRARYFDRIVPFGGPS